MLRKLMKSIREYKTASILSILFVTLEAVMECALPLATSKLVDQINDKNMSELTMYSIIIVVMAILSLVFGAAAGYFCSKASAGFAKNLRKDMYENITKFSFSNIDKSIVKCKRIYRTQETQGNAQCNFLLHCF